MIKILANDGIDSAGKKIFEAAGFSISTDKIAQENLSDALKNFKKKLERVNKFETTKAILIFEQENGLMEYKIKDFKTGEEKIISRAEALHIEP